MTNAARPTRSLLQVTARATWVPEGTKAKMLMGLSGQELRTIHDESVTSYPFWGQQFTTIANQYSTAGSAVAVRHALRQGRFVAAGAALAAL